MIGDKVTMICTSEKQVENWVFGINVGADGKSGIQCNWISVFGNRTEDCRGSSNKLMT